MAQKSELWREIIEKLIVRGESERSISETATIGKADQLLSRLIRVETIRWSFISYLAKRYPVRTEVRMVVP